MLHQQVCTGQKGPLTAEAAAAAAESFWKIVTNITPWARQVEPCPLFDLYHFLTFFFLLTEQEVKVLRCRG